MRSLLALALLFSFAVPLHAQDFKQNAWGVIAAPMTYHLIDGYEYEVNESNTSLDFGLFYTRFFSRSWSGRFEVFLLDRDLRTFEKFLSLTPAEIGYFSVEEATVQTALVLDADERIDLSGHEGRFSLGVGLTLSAVYDQTISRPAENPRAGDPQAGTYYKWGWLVEGGMSLALKPDFGVFARLRVQQDENTFNESDDADIVRKLAAFGFHVGAEFVF